MKTAVNMDVLETVRQHFGDEAAEYLARKNTGGNNNAKGGRHERYYAAYHLASLFPLLEEEDNSLIAETQVEAFVDDLILTDTSRGAQRHYQLKDSPTIAWGAFGKEKTINDDFLKQKELNDLLGVKTTRTTLVLSDKAKAKALSSKIPNKILSHSSVEHFSNAVTGNRVLLEEPRLRKALEGISASKDIDKLELLLSVVTGVWENNNGEACRVFDLLEKVKLIQPSFLRTEQLDVLNPQCQEILDHIDNFTYTTHSGYLEWEYLDGLDSGTFFYPVGSKEFTDFQRALIAGHVSRFEDIEGMLT